MNIYPFKAAYPDLDLITSPDSFFSSVKYDYPDVITSGFYTKLKKSAFYVYQISSGKSINTGLIANIDIKDYDSGHILPHEKTLTATEQEMMRSMLKRKAMIKPVLLGYSQVEEINKSLKRYIKNKKPFLNIHFELSKTKHKFWQIDSEPLITKLYDYFDKINEVFIADGHHRCSTFNIFNKNKLKYDASYNFDNLLCAFFPLNELSIYSYNRVVDLLNESTYSQLMAGVSKYVDIKPISNKRVPKNPREMILVLPHESYALKWKKTILNAHKSNILDTTLFNTYILNKLLGITNIRNDQRVKYVKGTLGYQGAYDKVIQKTRGVGFILYPVDINDFKNIAKKHKVLPPKSTLFEPRLVNGLITQEFQ